MNSLRVGTPARLRCICVSFLKAVWKSSMQEMHFCAESEPVVSDVYERVEASESLSHSCLTSKLARGNQLVLLNSHGDVLMHLS